MPQKTSRRKVSKRSVEKLLKQLEEIRLAFPLWYGVGSIESSPKEEVLELTEEHSEPVEQTLEDSEPEPEDDGGEYRTSFDPWDIQFAVDNAASSLLKDKIVPDFENLDEAPSFAEFFAELFGEENEMTKQVEYFEELISGYEETVSRADLEEAYNVLEGVIESLQSKPEKPPRMGGT